MEFHNQSKHLFSFVPYTATLMLGQGGWQVERLEYQFGKWSPAARFINAVGSLFPRAVATGLIFHCRRCEQPATGWRLR